MTDDKNTLQKKEQEEKEKKRIKPGEIIGRIDVHDTRERRDAPAVIR